MVQTPKEEIKNNILKAAREEFLRVGFEKASIRNITAQANTSKSNIYHYFPDKDALFAAVVEPTVTEMRASFARIKEGNKQKSVQGYTSDAQRQIMISFGGFMFDHQEDFTLLFFRSGGSSLASFKATLVESLADVLEDWVDVIAPGRDLSRIFLSSVAGFYIGAIEQLLEAGKTKEQVGVHMNEFLQFAYGGWKNILTQQPS